eukprot:2860025-Rhodomonas_salina.1
MEGTEYWLTMLSSELAARILEERQTHGRRSARGQIKRFSGARWTGFRFDSAISSLYPTGLLVARSQIQR